MADQKISELTELLALSDNDMLPVLNTSGAITDKVSPVTIREYVTGSAAAYYPDYNETDQGYIGAGKSVKAYVDGIGAEYATLIFQHNSGGAITTYTFASDETIPANVRIIIENGAILSTGTGVTVTISGSFESGLYQVFSGAGNISFEDSATDAVYLEWFGAVGDDATSNATAIQNAINSVFTNGVLTSGGGIYRFGTALTLPSNFTIDGREITVFKPDITNVSAISNSGSVNITVKNMKFDGSLVTTASVDTVIMAFNNVTELFILNNEIKDVPVSAMKLIDIARFQVDGNYIKTTGTAGYKAADPVETGGGILCSNLQDGQINNNILYDLWAVGIYLMASGGSKTHNIVIDGNVINGSADNGIRLDALIAPSLEDISNVVISNNSVVDIDGSGVRLSGAFNLCTGNVIQLQNLTVSDADPNHTPHGIHVDGGHDNVVTGNIIYDGTHIMKSGIKIIANQDKDISRVLVEGNVISGIGFVNGKGITVYQHGTETLQSISIKDNFIYDTHVDGGIRVADVSEVNISGNYVSSNYKDGIYVKDCLDVIITGNTSKNNNLQDSGTQSGIRAENIDGILINSNRCFDDQGVKTQTYGIYLHGTTDHVSVINNDLRGNKTIGYADGITITDFIVNNNLGFVTEAGGAAATIADGGTITHGLAGTPDYVIVSPSITGEFISVTALGSANFTVAIKKHDNSAGTTQTVYWRAYYIP